MAQVDRQSQVPSLFLLRLSLVLLLFYYRFQHLAMQHMRPIVVHVVLTCPNFTRATNPD
jgi:hypothetical protein